MADETLTTTSCPSCGVLFGMPPALLDERRDKGGNFWCPNGHSLSFTKTTVQSLREQLDKEVKRRNKMLDDAYTSAARERELREQVQRSRASYKAANTRLRRRLVAATEDETDD